MMKKRVFFLVLPLVGFLLISQASKMLKTSPPDPPLSMPHQQHTSLTKPSSKMTSADGLIQRKQKRTITLVVRMRGEMANLLSHWVFAKGIQLWLEDNSNLADDEGIQVKLIGERQSGTKWKGAVTDLQTCFPNLKHLEYQGGRRDPVFRARRQQQIEWVGGEDNHRTHLVIDGGDSDCGSQELFCLYSRLSYLQTLWNQGPPQNVGSKTTTADPVHSNYSLPFLVANQLASFDVLVDQYYNQIKEWLWFDYNACCSPDQPGPDEVVFHLRNFRAEMRERNYLERGYEELSPQQAAMELLGHLPAGTHVAIASRGDAHVQPFVDALTERGLVVRRTSSNHTGAQDFCFLLRARRELAGTMRSTYTRWAALLGEAQRVQLYSIDSAFTRQAHDNDDNFTNSIHYAWKRPELQRKIHYRVFSSDFETDEATP